MSFWDMSDGESAIDGKTEYEAPTGNFDPIPDGSNVLSFIEEAKWDEHRDGNRFLNLKWRVEQPEEFLNRVIFQKLWILDDDPNVKDADKMKKKRDKAKKMLAAIDANSGGKLGRKAGIPTNDDLALALQTRQMVLRLQVWEMPDGNGGTNSGNWISAVFPKNKEVRIGELAAPASAPARGASVPLDDDIPF